MIHYKMYLESCQKKSQKLDPSLVEFFCNSNVLKLEIKDKALNEEHKILHLFESMNAHARLTQITLTYCDLSDDSLDLLLFKLG